MFAAVGADRRAGIGLVTGPPERGPHRGWITDYLLDAGHSENVDRLVARALCALVPTLPEQVRATRQFLVRGLHRCLTEHGITQVVDLSSMIPATPGTHTVADKVAPGARVAYVVDTLPMHSMARTCLGDPRHRAVLSTSDTPATTWQKLTDGPDGLDPTEPVALLAVNVLDHIEQPEQALDFLAGWNTNLPTGSVLVLSHGTDDGLPPAEAAAAATMRQVYRAMVGEPLVVRTREEVAELLTAAGIEPHTELTGAHRWHAGDKESPESRSWACTATVGRA